MKNRVIGLGGIFMRSKNPKELNAWYKTHLGMDMQDWGCVLMDKQNATDKDYSVFSFFKEESKKFDPSTKQFMINLRVEDLDGLLEVLKSEGVNVLENTEDSEYGKFGWILDPEDNKIELWEAPK